MATHPPYTSPGSNHLALLLAMRGSVFLIEVVLLIIFYAIGMRASLTAVAIVMALQLFTNIFTALRLRRERPVGDAEFFGHIFLDIAALTAIFYLTGGYANPLIWAYLLPLIVSAIILPSFYAWFTTVITIGCYAALIFWNVPLEHVHDGHTNAFNLHLHGMWLGFVFSAGIVAHFVVRLSGALRERERLLAQAREKVLEQERVVALGALAAGAAHELGTPLATMAVLTRELESDYASDTELNASLRLLRQQVDRCKDILSSMAKAHGHPRADSAAVMSIDEFLNDVINRWQEIHPGIPIKIHFNAFSVGNNILAERTLSQAITNLLDNAADASPDGIEIIAAWNDRELDLQIIDQGDGLPAHHDIGEPFITTKKHGQGLGVYLSRTVIEGLGGHIKIVNREEGGVVAHIHIPVHSLQVK
jgi:two-component system sensor histidine kinase RegB